MDSFVNSPLLAKLLDLSIALFVLFVLNCALAWVAWHLYKQGQLNSVAHATALAEVNAKRLSESDAYAQNRRESSEQLRSIVEQLNNVLRTVQTEKLLSPADRKVLFAIATKLGCTPAELQ